MPKPDVQWSQLTIFLTMPLCLRHLDHIFYSCRNQTATPPIAVRNVTESRSIYIKTALLSVYTSSSISIVLDASFFLRCHFKSPQCLEPNGFLFVWLPHHIGAMLCWDRVHSGVFFLPPPVCCLRVRGTINKHCAFMERSCVAQQGISRAAWLYAWIKCLPSTVLMFMSYCLNSTDLYGI